MTPTNQKTILIVDDHTENLKVLADFLSSGEESYNVMVAPSGIIALKIINKRLPDLIISDWEMPLMDGIELLKKLKENEKTKDIPVIMFTGAMTSPENLKTALEAGAIDYIRKPADGIEIFARVRSVLMLAESHKKLKEKNLELNKAYDDLHENKNSFEMLVKSSPRGIAMVDTEGKLLQYNKVFASICSKIGLHIEKVNFFEELEEETQIFKVKFHECIKTKETIEFDFHHKRKRLELFAQISFSVIYSRQQEVIGVQLTVEDVSGRVQNEKKLKESNATKDKFFSIVANDLNSTFNSLINISDLLKSSVSNKDKEQPELYINIIKNTATGGFRLLKNLMEWADIQTGKVLFTPEMFELGSVISEVVHSFKDSAREKKVRIDILSTDETYVNADIEMVKSILRNLISNGVKFTNSIGSVTIEYKTTGNSHVNITVSDTGVGMDNNELLKLFVIGENFSKMGTRRETGTGLGLLLCKEYIDLHQSEIKVRSRKGAGSSFIFSLPLAK